MKRASVWLTSLRCLCFCFIAIFVGSAQAAAPTNLIAQQSFYEDPTGELTFADVREKSFTPYTGILTKGFSESVFWIKLTIDPNIGADRQSKTEPRFTFSLPPPRATAGELVVRVRPPYLDDIRLYDPLEPEKNSRVTGDLHSWLDSEFRSLNHGFVIPEGSEPRTIWLRVQSTSTMLVGLDVYPYDVVQGLERRQELISTIDIVLILFLILWGGAIFVSRPDKVVGAFLLAMVATFFFATNYLGYYRIFLGDFLPPDFSDKAYSVLVMVMPATLLLFHRRVIAEYQPKPWMKALLLPGQYYFVVGLALYYLGYQTLALQTNALIVLLSTAWICVTLMFGVKRESWAHPDSALLSKNLLLGYYVLLTGLFVMLALPALNLLPPAEASLGRSLIHGAVSFGALAGIVLLRGRLLEQKRQRALASAEQAAHFEKSKRVEQDQFFAMLTHEIRTPLTVMTYAAQTSLPDDQLRDHVKQSIQEIDQIIERCVQADKVDQEGIPLALSRVKISDLINDTLERFSRQRLTLTFSLDSDRTLATDVSLFHIVAGNLIENALKYSPRDSTVSLCVSDRQKIGLTEQTGQVGLSILVSNLVGPAGLPDPQKLFDKYYRAPRARNITGSGLGLFVARSFAAKIGAQLHYQTYDNQIVFELWIPT